VTAWLLGILTTIGGAVIAVVMVAAKADLEDADVYRWLTRKLVYRASRRLPREERARWRAEAMQNVLDLPGRLPPLWWALDTYARSGRWGRERGAPSRWQALVARVWAAWHRLRSLPEERSKERHPPTSPRARVEVEVEVEAEPAHAAAAALDATVTLNPASIVSEARVGVPRLVQATPKQRASSSFLSKQDEEFLARLAGQSEVFLAQLAQQRRNFDNYIDRRR
jgi:hypothetical protein